MEGIQSLSRLDAALINEKRTIDFFMEQAKNIKNPLGKDMFQDLAEKGRRNFRMLYRFRRRRAGERPGLNDSLENSAAAFEGSEDDFEKRLSREIARALADYDDYTILEAASSLIDKASAFFSHFSEMIKDPAERELFRSLAGMKHEHFLDIRDVEEYLKDPGSWFAEMEHHGLDGA